MLDTQRFATKALRIAVSYYGYSLTDEANLLLVGRNRRDSNEILRTVFGPAFPVEQIRKHAGKLYSQYVKVSDLKL